MKPNLRDAAVIVGIGHTEFSKNIGRPEQTIALEAIKMALDDAGVSPKDVDVSTDLGVSYYYLNDPDRALQQFQRSLAIDPKHTKTILNMGIVRALSCAFLLGIAILSLSKSGEFLYYNF